MRHKIEVGAEPVQTENGKERYVVYVILPPDVKVLYKNYADSAYANKKAIWLGNMIKIEHLNLKLTNDFKDIFDCID